MSSPCVTPGPTPDHDFHTEVRQHLSRNFCAHTLDLGFYFAGMSFVAFDTVLPPALKALQGPGWLIALVPALVMSGFSLPALFTSGYIEGLAWKKPLIVLTGVFQRLPFLLAGLVLIGYARDYPMTALCLTALAPVVSCMMCGISLPAWQELIAKTIPTERRSSMMGMGLFLGSVASLPAGALVAAVLDRWPGPTGYGILHLLAFCLMTLSYLSFLWVKETCQPTAAAASHWSLWANLAAFRDIYRTDFVVRRYTQARVATCGAFIVIPFLPLRAMAVLDAPPSLLGWLVVAGVLGGCAGTIAAALIGDKLGGRPTLLLARITFLMMSGIALFATREWHFHAAFFLLGFARFCEMISHNVYSMEIAPARQRASVLGLINVSAFPGMMLAGITGAVLWQSFGSFQLLNLATAVTIALSLGIVLTLPEPRGTHFPAV